MLKFIKQHMATISGIEIYPLISFILFFTFFVGVLFWVWKGDQKFFKQMSDVPLDDN
jgi:cytochrome c oxidase cbb3-type subunit IV